MSLMGTGRASSINSWLWPNGIDSDAARCRSTGMRRALCWLSGSADLIVSNLAACCSSCCSLYLSTNSERRLLERRGFRDCELRLDWSSLTAECLSSSFQALMDSLRDRRPRWAEPSYSLLAALGMSMVDGIGLTDMSCFSDTVSDSCMLCLAAHDPARLWYVPTCVATCLFCIALVSFSCRLDERPEFCFSRRSYSDTCTIKVSRSWTRLTMYVSFSEIFSCKTSSLETKSLRSDSFVSATSRCWEINSLASSRLAWEFMSSFLRAAEAA
mmetsp:Transcript_122880/g.352905  ORF Transcript_122880/g.352905 Transcript_122880/m.352905 type:complete len:271 (-) Transcript_122880:309-1121(-)